MGEVRWKIADHLLNLSQNALIMGVLNVTPDSFSDGGKFISPDHAVEHGLRMAADGAHIIDVGGESTRPGSKSISADEEIARVRPVIARLREKVDAMISIDTSKAVVAHEALEAGASIINDVSGGRADPAMMRVAAEKKAAIVIMHMQGTPETMQMNPIYNNVVTEVADFFRQQYASAVKSGIDSMAVAFDPGIGFGKTIKHNVQLL